MNQHSTIICTLCANFLISVQADARLGMIGQGQFPERPHSRIATCASNNKASHVPLIYLSIG